MDFVAGGKKRIDEYDGYDGELYAIYILHNYQKQGIGKALVNAFANDLSKKGFESMIVRVLEQNPARYFYESLGGKFIGREMTKIGKQRLETLVYGWEDLSVYL
ncbi:GNAT family N-acetyltransferase [Fervidibacillus albus]|uniref:GNAT family N-acetyltransferase n=1 Tax=Fervidibacillus albus TaxID=2980026 RepID=UPI00308410C4